MSRSPPDTLVRLLGAKAGPDQESAWQHFLAEHSRLIHLAARKSARGYDDVMDRYTFVLEGLRRDDYKRLRGFAPGGRSAFTTWLVVVASRLCVDYHRSKYGRVPSGAESSPEVEGRRRLVDLVGEAIEMEDLPDRASADAATAVAKEERREALAEALATLSPGDRLLVTLRFGDGRPMTEIARTLGLSSEFAGYRRLKQVLERLRDELRRRGIEDST